MRIYKIALNTENIWYHGSDRFDIQKFQASENKFQLLGNGIYFYKNSEPAKQYGSFIYSIKISPQKYNIADENFRLSYDDIGGIFNKTFTNKDPSGVLNPIWWATEGWNYYKLDRKETIDKISQYIQNQLGFDGIKAIYGNGGLVLCMWKKYDTLIPHIVS